ncbi:hypothetical protein B0T18DRAFT_57114 [Schizothecium vesticola]|uniref:CorA-like transporter domain-containing protein n=1 Tax=Schizothecium vesticola TaxID=314040 RepID=A0AA40F4A2_9PEZI|nr:hypothetical protein B0T18DRAFT_57114 [Schizothecium vesticola]
MAPGSPASARTENEAFCHSLLNFELYPDNLPQEEKPKLVSIFKRHFHQAKDTITLIPPTSGFRRKLVLRTVDLLISDRGNPKHLEASEERADEHITGISGPEVMKEFLGFKEHHDCSTQKTCSSASPFRSDPVVRFILVGTSAEGRLKITSEMLLQILTYHHVCPSFLQFISYNGSRPLTSGSDLLFGNLRCLKFFGGPDATVNALGRSGHHYQLVFEIKTVFNPQDWRDAAAAEDEEAVWLWPIMKTTVYHRFDVVTGTSLWIITTGDETTTRSAHVGPYDFRSVRNIVEVPDVKTETPICKRFTRSLDVMEWLMEWSLSEYSSYIAFLDGELGRLTERYTLGVDGGTSTTMTDPELKKVGRMIQSMDQLIVGLHANMRVYKALGTFYRSELFQDRELKKLKPEWITQSGGAPQRHAKNVASSLMNIHHQTNNMLERATVVHLMGTKRQDMVHRLIQSRNEQTTRDLSRITQNDSSTMKVFSNITLVLLPMSVVSTVFTTGIVDFRGEPGFVGQWSAAAFVWWISVTAAATLLVLGISVWKRRQLRLKDALRASEHACP